MSKYRPDIDGLRAVAVGAVLFFHAFPLHVPGGFAGVDIFFVISGFLISGIILTGLERGRFSFIDFYSRRIRRIFPALVLVCAACLVFGWFCLMPAGFRRLGRHVLGGAAFVSNFVVLRESGYFDFSATLKPLRHLWSLGVEEQYYLVWPALLFLCRKSKRATGILLIALALASFAFSLYMTWADRAVAYYLPLTRFWELMIGSGLAFVSIHGTAGLPGLAGLAGISDPRLAARLANAKAILGAISVALAFILINERRMFPGGWALLPCVGSALIISAGPDAWINRRILASRLFVRVGLISYPLYLWHWPFLSFANIIDNHTPSIAYRAAALAASVAFAWATYEFVELPVRQGKGQAGLRRVALQLAGVMGLIAVGGAVVDQSIVQSISARDPVVVKISEATIDWEGIDSLTVPGSVATTVLFLGDSVMEQYWPRAELVTQRAPSRRTVEFRTKGGCAPIPEIARIDRPCAEFVRASLARAAQADVDTVIFAAYWGGLTAYHDYYRPGGAEGAPPLDVLAPENAWVFEGFEQSLARLRQLHKRLIVLTSSPRGDDFDPYRMVERRGLIPRAKSVPPVSRAALASSFAAIDARIRAAAEKAGAEVLDPMDWFCDGPVCRPQDSAGSPISIDGIHIRASVVRERASALDQFIVTAPRVTPVRFDPASRAPGG
jgi:peptidoglycan/LPS O-acetylase OafA/YrhL